MGTEVHVVKAVPRLHDRRPAARAWLALVSAHPHVVADLGAELGRKPRLDLPDAAHDDRTYRVEKATELLLAERGDAPLRMEPCLPEDLVGVRVADPGDEGLIHEQVPQLPPRRPSTLRELRRAPVERAGVGSEVREAVHVAEVVAFLEDVHLSHPHGVADSHIVTLRADE